GADDESAERQAGPGEGCDRERMRERDGHGDRVSLVLRRAGRAVAERVTGASGSPPSIAIPETGRRPATTVGHAACRTRRTSWCSPSGRNMGGTMHIFGFEDYVGPEVQGFHRVPVPTVGPETIRIRVLAAGVNPADVKVRSGARQQGFPVVFPMAMGR